MTVIMLFIGIAAAAAIIAFAFKVPNTTFRAAAGLVALVVLFFFVTLSSIRFVGDDEVGIIVKNVGFKNLPQGRIIATEGEKGPQAAVLPPGWHPWFWPGIFDIEAETIVHVKQGHVGLLTTTDGQPMPRGEIYAPQWSQEEFQKMLDAEHFLAESGYKGPQASVLTPGDYRLNTRLFHVEMVPITNVEKATVGVIKSNVGDLPPGGQGSGPVLVDEGQRGIWRNPVLPQELYLNTRAYEVTIISTRETIIRYTAQAEGDEEREIQVRTSDGFTFPVDVRVQYAIHPEDAPRVVAIVGSDGAELRDVLNSTVRAIFRNNAETVKALDYVNLRSQQESQSLEMIAREMKPVGVTVTAVKIGDIGDEESLGLLLKTQKDREIAVQEQITFQEQQRAAEQKKELTRTEQEAEEERRLATAAYEVQIADEHKQRLIIEAGAEAEAIRIKAEAQAEAYRVIVEQIGQRNAAMLALLEIVGERGINITPRVMVFGENGGSATAPGGVGSDAQTAALIGTMLEKMVEEE